MRERRAAYLSCDCITLTKKKKKKKKQKHIHIHIQTNWLAGCIVVAGRATSIKVLHKCMEQHDARWAKRGKTVSDRKSEGARHCIQLMSVIEIQMKVKWNRLSCAQIECIFMHITLTSLFREPTRMTFSFSCVDIFSFCYYCTIFY